MILQAVSLRGSGKGYKASGGFLVTEKSFFSPSLSSVPMSTVHLGGRVRPHVVGIVVRIVQPRGRLIKLYVYGKLGNLKAELCVPFQTLSWLFRIELLSMSVDSLVSSIHSSHSWLRNSFMASTYDSQIAKVK